jgi:hypothetical protein
MIEAANNSGGAPVAAPDDGSVIEALRRGDKIAFAHLVDRYHASLRRVARPYTWIFRILINSVGGINALHPRSPPRAPLPCRPPPPPHAGFPLAPWAQRR